MNRPSARLVLAGDGRLPHRRYAAVAAHADAAQDRPDARTTRSA